MPTEPHASDRTENTWHPSGHCPLIACDIASFGDLRRTDHVQRHVRTALYARLRESFDRSGVPFADCYREDRGDGVIIVVPSAVSVATLVSPLIDRVWAELRKHNEVSTEIARIRLRVALHIGEVHSDDEGIVGTAVNHTFRILEAPEFKQALSASDACLAFIASEQVYDEVIRHAIDLINPADYRPIEVRVKETETRAWVRVPGERRPVPTTTQELAARDPAAADISSPGHAPPRKIERLAGGALFRIVDRLLDIPIMANESGREQVVGALRKEIAAIIPRQAEARMDAYCILRTCLQYPGGLPELLGILNAFVGDSAAMRELERTIARLLDEG